MCIILEDCQSVRYSPLFYAVHDKLAGCGHENNVKHAFLTYPNACVTCITMPRVVKFLAHLFLGDKCHFARVNTVKPLFTLQQPKQQAKESSSSQ